MKSVKSSRSGARGASLVEVLVAVGVILALGLIAVRTIGGASQDQGGREASCVETLTCAPSGAAKAAPSPSVDLKDVPRSVTSDLALHEATSDEQALAAARDQMTPDELQARLDAKAMAALRLIAAAHHVVRDRMTPNGGEEARAMRARAVAMVEDYADSVEALRSRGVPVENLAEAYRILELLQNEVSALGTAIRSTPGMNDSWMMRAAGGFVLGGFADDESFAATIGQGAGSLIPWVWIGVAARDVTHAGIRLYDSGGREGWVELGMTVASTPPGARYLIHSGKLVFRGAGGALDAVNRWVGIGAASETERIFAREAGAGRATQFDHVPTIGSRAAPIVRTLDSGERISLADLIAQAKARTLEDDIAYFMKLGSAPDDLTMNAARAAWDRRQVWIVQLEALQDAFAKHPGRAGKSIFIDISGKPRGPGAIPHGPVSITPSGYVEMRLHGPGRKSVAEKKPPAFQENLSALDVANTIRDAGGANRPVFLMSCNAGTAIEACPILAQKLADELKQPVVAADREVLLDDWSTENFLGRDRKVLIPIFLNDKIPDSAGRWRVFLPTAKSN